MRIKTRLRFYPPLNSKSSANLELKHKVYDKGYKDKLIIPAEKVTNFLEDPTSFSNDDLPLAITYLYTNNLFPLVKIGYERLAFTGEHNKGDLRMTIDSNTCCSRYKGDLDFPTIPLFISGDSIFEIKTSDAIPLWLQRIIIKYGLKRFAISKYGFSIEKLSQSNEIAIHDNFLLNF